MTDLNQIKEELLRHGYEYVDTIGSGSFSSVYLVKSAQYNHFFAAKRVLKQEFNENEIESLISLIHPNIVKLYLTFSEGDHDYMIMEYCLKGTIMQRRKIDHNQFLFYSKQLLEVLEYCHSQKVAHRDIKPENIFLDEYDHVKLGDFGLSGKFLNQEMSTKKCGSLMFCSPEILTDKEFDPFSADIWALGITFFYMTTGHHPYNDRVEDLRDQILNSQIDFSSDNVHPKIQYLIKKMTSKNCLFRPSASQLLKFSLFGSTVKQGMIKKTVSSYPANFSHQLKLSKISPQGFYCADTFSDKENEKDELGGKKKISKIHSIRNCGLYINIYKKNCWHFEKYD